MLVRLHDAISGPDGRWVAGATIDLDQEAARALVAAGHATATGAAAREAETPPVFVESD